MTLQCSQTCVGSLFFENSTALIASKGVTVCELEQEIEIEKLRVGLISWVEEKEINL